MRIFATNSVNQNQPAFSAKLISVHKPVWGEFVVPKSWHNAAETIGDVNGVVLHDRIENLRDFGGNSVDVFKYFAPGKSVPLTHSEVKSADGTYRIPTDKSLDALEELGRKVNAMA